MYQAKILKNGAYPRCQLCAHGEETIQHIISGCPKIVTTEYLQRDDWIAKLLRWTLCNYYEISHTEKWYQHAPESEVEGKNVTILCDLTVHANRKIDANRPDLIIENHEERNCIMMDMSVPSDQSISLKEFQKLSYKDFEIEVIKM